ncbi:alpha/beta hydrolase [Corynebacterium phocae]|nr:alpha/beta hydrolase [Corynebacterium phocae]
MAAHFSQAATTLAGQRSKVLEFQHQSLQLWESLWEGVQGPAPAAAARFFQTLESQRRAPVEQMAQVVEILEEYNQRAERARTHALRENRELVEEALDILCARAITQACVAPSPAPARGLSSMQGLSLPAIHALNFAEAPAYVRAMVEENPDITLLEVGNGTVAALVPPDGPHGLDELTTHPASVTTFVPGVSSTLPENLGDQISHARSLATATRGPAIAWLGYGAPRTVVNAAQKKSAVQGARRFEVFQRAVDARWPDSHKVVVGHSFGSVVVGGANLRDSGVDDFVIIGSPGVQRDTAAELGVRTWAARSDLDPIGLVSGVYGTDPTSPRFGARRLGSGRFNPGGHSSYFEDPGFLKALGALV